MDEKDLLKLWSKKRTEIIFSQIPPTFMLGVLVYISATQDLKNLAVHTKWFIVVATAVVGIFGILSQIGITQDGRAIAKALEGNARDSYSKSVIRSIDFFTINGILVNLLGITVFGFLVYSMYR